MNLQKITTFLLLFALIVIGCGDNADKTAADSDNMAQFTEDEEFKNAHDSPQKLDYTPKGKMFRYITLDGKKPAMAYVARNNSESKKVVFLIHEWWGLNDYIKQEADRIAESIDSINVIALDLYDGMVTDNPEEAGKLMGKVQEERAKAIIEGAFLRTGEDGEIAVMGWCFGGGWALKATIMAGEKGKACVIYYGLPVKTAAELAPLQAPVLGIFGKNDKWINPKVVKEFEDLVAATKKDLTVRSFDADHAFANPSSDKYKEKTATEANQLALEFLKKNL